MPTQKKSHFEGIEHYFAKTKYADILRRDWLRVDIEKPISREGWVYFIPDIAVYDQDGIAGVFEIVFTHDVDLYKMHRIWTFANDCMRPLFLRTITAENIINDKFEFLMDVIL